MNENFRSGFVSIIGMPNAGKSTLYNRLLGETLAIVNPKAQTTRHRILGVKNGPGFQIVVNESVADSDVLILMIDIKGRQFTEEIKEKFEHAKAKKIVALNKVDLSNQSDLEAKLEEIKENFKADIYLPISAEHGFQVEVLEEYIEKFLPEHPAYFPDDQLTDRSERFFVNEIIRNNILKLYDEEIPYACEVMSLSFKENKKLIKINCEIIVERDSQKPILIGKRGDGIKNLGIESRKELEAFFGKQVFLELYVKVREDWRNNNNMLKQFGYDQE